MLVMVTNRQVVHEPFLFHLPLLYHKFLLAANMIKNMSQSSLHLTLHVICQHKGSPTFLKPRPPTATGRLSKIYQLK